MDERDFRLLSSFISALRERRGPGGPGPFQADIGTVNFWLTPYSGRPDGVVTHVRHGATHLEHFVLRDTSEGLTLPLLTGSPQVWFELDGSAGGKTFELESADICLEFRDEALGKLGLPQGPYSYYISEVGQAYVEEAIPPKATRLKYWAYRQGLPVPFAEYNLWMETLIGQQWNFGETRRSFGLPSENEDRFYLTTTEPSAPPDMRYWDHWGRTGIVTRMVPTS